VAGPPAVKVTGAREFRAALERMGGDVKDVTALNRRLADDVAQAARQRVPIKTGRLSKSIRARASKTRAGVNMGGRLAVYGPPIHFGWRRRNIEPQPFLYDALDARRHALVGMYQGEVERLVKKLDRETPG